MTEITAKQMPSREQLFDAYITIGINGVKLPRYIDWYARTGDHDMSIYIVEHSIRPSTFERAERLGVSFADLYKQLEPHDLYSVDCLDLIEHGDNWELAIKNLLEVRLAIDAHGIYLSEYVQLRGAYEHAHALRLLVWLEGYWANFPGMSSENIHQEIKTMVQLGRKGLSSDDLMVLMNDKRLTGCWDDFGEAIAGNKVTVSELLGIADARGHVHRYLILKKAVGDCLTKYPVKQIADVTQNSSMAQLKLYVKLREQRVAHEAAWYRAFKTPYKALRYKKQ